MSKIILFQGDSITDCERDRRNPESMGRGYPRLVQASLGAQKPLEYVFLNRGVSGNRIVDIYARIKKDIINLKPDYMSMYIGINDVWHEVNERNGVAPEKFEKIYTMLLEEIYAQLPDIKILLLAPYVLNGTATCNTEENPNRFEFFRTGVDKNIEVVKRIGEKFSLPVIELQPIFDNAIKLAPENYWTKDGVHPTAMGHELIKNAWIECFNTEIL